MTRKRTAPTYLKRTENGKAYAYCYLFGAQKRLGSYGTKDSFRRFEQCLAAFEQDNEELADYGHEPEREITVGELGLRYYEHMEDRLHRKTLCKDRVVASRTGMRHLSSKALGFAGINANKFGPKALKQIQAHLVNSSNPKTKKLFARTYVNQNINEIRRAFKWAVSEELVTVNVFERLKTVNGLKSGEGRETEPRQPAEPELVEQTIAHLEQEGHSGIAGALRFMRWTGCRPDEACRLTLRSLEGLNSPDPVARLREHKSRKKTGQDRVIPLGSKALTVVKDAMRQPELERRLFLSRAGRPLVPNGIYQAVQRTCQRYGLKRWTPYQLRTSTRKQQQHFSRPRRPRRRR